KISDPIRQPGLGTESAAKMYFEAPDRLAVNFPELGYKAQVMNVRQCGVVFGGGKTDFKFSSHFLAYGVAEKIPEDSFRVGSDIEWFFGVHTGGFGGGDVSDRVAAGFPDGDVVLVQFRPKFRGPVQAHVVNLDVLPGGDVQPSCGVLVRNIGYPVELFGSCPAIRQLDPYHW